MLREEVSTYTDIKRALKPPELQGLQVVWLGSGDPNPETEHKHQHSSARWVSTLSHVLGCFHFMFSIVFEFET